MKNYSQLLKTCERVSKLSEAVIDRKLMYFADNNDRLGEQFFKRLAMYKHVANELDESFTNFAASQYIVYEIFKARGLGKKYLQHSKLPAFSKEEMEYLKWNISNPWRFSYSIVLDSPEKDFYKMVDVFTHEEYLLYSKSVSQYLETTDAKLWFNLISFNGDCWQSFGPVIPFSGIIPDDLFFFVTELYPNAEIENEQDIYGLIDKNPVTFQMLFAFSNIPLVCSKGDLMIHTLAWMENFALDTSRIKEDYIIEYNEGIYRCKLRNWEHPHFSTAYYEEEEKLLTLCALTDKGFEALFNSFQKHGFIITDEPDIRVTPVMVNAAQELLQKRITINEYYELFEIDIPEEEEDQLDSLNEFMTAILPDLNAGKKPDIEKLAIEYGVDIDTAKDLIKLLENKLK